MQLWVCFRISTVVKTYRYTICTKNQASIILSLMPLLAVLFIYAFFYNFLFPLTSFRKGGMPLCFHTSMFLCFYIFFYCISWDCNFSLTHLPFSSLKKQQKTFMLCTTTFKLASLSLILRTGLTPPNMPRHKLGIQQATAFSDVMFCFIGYVPHAEAV